VSVNRLPHVPSGTAAAAVPTAAPDLRRMLKPAARGGWNDAQLWLLTLQVQLDVPGAKLLALVRACGWTEAQYAALLAQVAAKLTR